jgi:hypothetical protein
MSDCATPTLRFETTPLEVEAAFDGGRITGLDPRERTDQSFECRVRRRESKRCQDQHHAIHQSSGWRPSG